MKPSYTCIAAGVRSFFVRKMRGL